MLKQSNHEKLAAEIFNNTSFAKDMNAHYSFGTARGLKLVMDAFNYYKDKNYTYTTEEIIEVIHIIARSNKELESMFLKLRAGE